MGDRAWDALAAGRSSWTRRTDIRAMDWGVFPERDEEQADWKIADAAIDAASGRSPRGQALLPRRAAFRLPHVPVLSRPRKWFDLFPETRRSRCPPVKDDDRDDVPRFAWYLHWKLPEPRLDWLAKTGQWRPLVRAYLAEHQLHGQPGRPRARRARGAPDAADGPPWSSSGRDHGWHLGEKGITGKNSLWERSTRVPLIFAGPGIARGVSVRQPVELLDLYPTLVELARLPPSKPGLEGHSLVPQLKDARAPRPWPAITTHNQGNHAVRTAQWRYIRYADGSEELYDHAARPERVDESRIPGALQDRARRTSPLAAHRRFGRRYRAAGSAFSRATAMAGAGKASASTPWPLPTANDHHPSSRLRRSRVSDRDGDRRCRYQPAG